MTNYNATHSLAFDTLNPINSFKVLDQFIVQNNSVAVVAFAEFSEIDQKIDQKSNVRAAHESSPYTILGWFELEASKYAIVKLQQQDENRDLNLTQLLTDRELQVATLIASGHSNKQAAQQLNISEWTVSAHLRRIFMKLNVESRSAMVYRCASLIQRFDQLQQIVS
jgi:DNA-binding CsgD family transcriptional regulator